MEDSSVPSQQSEIRIELDRQSLLYLLDAGKWSKFLAILGFIFIGLLVLIGFFFGSVMSAVSERSGLPFPGYIFGFIYAMIAAIYFFPVYYLYNFSSLAYQGITERNGGKIGAAIKNLKSMFKFMGIFTIVILAMYVFALLILMAVGAGSMLGNSVNA